MTTSRTIKKDQRIFITFQREGIHRFPEAATNPAFATGDWLDVSFLASPHRHIFHFRVEISVGHANRDLEFIQAKRIIEHLYASGTLSLDHKSCEMMSDDLYAQLIQIYGEDRTYVIEISEDGENGSRTEYTPV